MAGLVADYGSDDSSDSETSSKEREPEVSREAQKGINYLEGTSSSDSEDDTATSSHYTGVRSATTVQQLPSPNQLNLHSKQPSERTLLQTSKLPNPLLRGPVLHTGKQGQDEQTSSIFHNPFRIAEQAKERVLEKHVKLTPNEKPARIAGKKICWNYRKGRCRFGHNCKYAHDSDIPLTHQHPEAPTGTMSASTGFFEQPEVFNDEEDQENPTQQRRKRPGLSQTLQPPKKSIKAYQKQQAVERPWMAQK